MRSRFLGILVGATLCAGALALQPAVAECGGRYPATVEADAGQEVTYCSDGTLEPFAPPTGIGNSECGGNHAVTVEADTGQGTWYCSDGTLG